MVFSNGTRLNPTSRDGKILNRMRIDEDTDPGYTQRSKNLWMNQL